MDMDTHTAEPTPLGTLEKLPTEIRLDIFKRILPEDFKQVYNITESGFLFSPHQSSPEPGYFNVSRQIRGEMTAARSNHRNITISLRTIITNFIAKINTKEKASLLAPDELTACMMLEVTIVRPSPRSATGFAQLRCNVHDFVDLLIRSTNVVPKLAVRLDYSHKVDRGLCGYNDFAVLMGPFYRLRTKPSRGVMMFRTTGSPISSPPIEKQCDLIEDTIKTRSDTSILRYQQCMLEIKIPLTLTFCTMEDTLSCIEKEVLRQRLALRASKACQGLKEWCSQTVHPVPSWMEPFQAQITKKFCVPDFQLRDEILGAHDNTAIACWLSGHNQAYNPFWDETLEG